MSRSASQMLRAPHAGRGVLASASTLSAILAMAVAASSAGHDGDVRLRG